MSGFFLFMLDLRLRGDDTKHSRFAPCFVSFQQRINRSFYKLVGE